jgi:glyoxylase-like metal-dependent hydrolase (beta-lactamase superfamily II)
MALIQRRFTLGPFETNSYVVHDDATREAAVIDVGFDPDAVRQAVERERLTVRWLLATHAHYDHIAAMAAMEDAFGLPVHLHPEDRPLLDGLASQATLFGLPQARPPRRLEPLAEGMRIGLGGESLEVLHTPGHSPGSVTFHGGDGLWVGDLLFAGSIGRTDFPGGDFALLARSVREKLYPLGDAMKVHPGHGPDTTIGIERLTNPFVGEGAMS